MVGYKIIFCVWMRKTALTTWNFIFILNIVWNIILVFINYYFLTIKARKIVARFASDRKFQPLFLTSRMPVHNSLNTHMKFFLKCILELVHFLKILVAVHCWLFTIPNLWHYFHFHTTFGPDDMFDINVVLKPLLMELSLPIWIVF